MIVEKRDISVSGALLTGLFSHLTKAVIYIEKNRKEGDQEGYEASSLASMAITTLEVLITGRELPKDLQQGLEEYKKYLEKEYKN